MAGTDTGLEPVVDQTQKLADHLASSRKSAEGLSSAFKGAFLALGGASLANKIVSEVVERSRLIVGFNRVTSAESMNQNVLAQRHLTYIDEAQAITKLRLKMGRDLTADEKLRLAALRAQLTEYQRQRQFNEEFRKFGHLRLALLGTAVGLTSQLFLKQRQFNQDLIEANSTWEHRGSLMRETLMMQTQLGVGFEKATEAIKALVHYGMDMESTFNENARLVAQMDQGLGIAMVQSAQLASIVERQLHGSFERVSHVIAQIVEDTALAGEEAVKLATNIATALGRLRPGIGAAGLPEVVRLVGRYESALKEISGQPGAFQDLINNLMSIKGMAGLGTLGVTPESLVNDRGIKIAMDRFAAFGKVMVGNAQGMARFQGLENLGEIFGVSGDQANQMLMAIKRTNQQQMGAITLQDRWRNQLHATDQGLHRLINSLTGLVQGALYWPVQLIGAIVNGLADLLEGALKYREVVYAATIAVGAGLLVLSFKAARLAWVLYGTMTAASAAVVALARLNATLLTTAATSATGAVGGVAGGVAGGAARTVTGASLLTGIRGLGATLLTGVTVAGAATVGAIAAASAVAVYFVKKDIDLLSEIKRLGEKNVAAQADILDREQTLKASREQKIYSLRRTGGLPEDILHQYSLLIQEMRAKATTPEDLQSKLQEAAKHFSLDMAKAGATDVMLTPLVDRTDKQRQQREEDRRLTEQILKVNEDQKTLFDKTYKLEQEKMQQRELEQIKQRAERNMSWMN